jgi:ABC-2 type transport system ATP-binding protein
MDHGKVLVLDTAEELKKLIPGGIFLELRVHIPERVLAGYAGMAQKTNLLEDLRKISASAKVEEVENGQQDDHLAIIRIYDQEASTLTVEATQAVARNGAEIRDIHVARPSLEDVFIYLTGRNLR